LTAIGPYSTNNQVGGNQSIGRSHSVGNTNKRDYLLNDDEDDETVYSGYTVSSVAEDLPTIIAPSTKILRFPMK
jgi:hypothetical protein